MTFYYLNALGMWEYNERNFDKVLMQACVKISYLLYNAHQLLLRGEYGVANINGFKGDYDLEFSYNGKNDTKSKLDGRYDCINKITLD